MSPQIILMDRKPEKNLKSAKKYVFIVFLNKIIQKLLNF